MTIKAIYFDMGGVIVRTEFQAPRQHLAERVGLDYEELASVVFDSETARQATIGLISEEEHWEKVTHKLHLPRSETQNIREEFFAGDIIDLGLVDALHSLRKQYKVGLISNAWSGARAWFTSRKLSDAFDSIVFSAEVGVAKPDARIFQIALEKLGVMAAESVFVDDSQENVEAARAFGMQAIHFTHPESALKELKQILANHH